MADQTDCCNSPSHGGGRTAPTRGRRFAVVLVPLSTVAGIGYRGAPVGDEGEGDPEIAAAADWSREFLEAWEVGDARKAGSDTDTSDNAESLVMRNLKPSKTEISASVREKPVEGEVRIPFSVVTNIPGGDEYVRGAHANVLGKLDVWGVARTTPVIHPELAPERPLAVRSRRRAPALDPMREVLRSPSLVREADPETATVTEGAGSAPRNTPGDPHATTGTAERDEEAAPHPRAWLIGYQGNRNPAWSVLGGWRLGRGPGRGEVSGEHWLTPSRVTATDA